MNDGGRWPLAAFSEPGTVLLLRWPDSEVIVTGTAAEQEFINSLPLHYRRNVTPVAGKTRPGELADQPRSPDQLVTGEAGPICIAIAAQVWSLLSAAKARCTGPCQESALHNHRPDNQASLYLISSVRTEGVEQTVAKMVG